MEMDQNWFDEQIVDEFSASSQDTVTTDLPSSEGSENMEEPMVNMNHIQKISETRVQNNQETKSIDPKNNTGENNSCTVVNSTNQPMTKQNKVAPRSDKHKTYQSKSRTTIYVPNIDINIKKSDLEAFFEEFGRIKEIFQSDRGGPNGTFAFVTYFMPIHARSAMDQLNAQHNMKIKMKNTKAGAVQDQGDQTAGSKHFSFMKIFAARQKIKKKASLIRDENSANHAKEFCPDRGQMDQESIWDQESVESNNHPIMVANSLLNHWITKLNFNRQTEKDENGQYVRNVILQLATLAAARRKE